MLCCKFLFAQLQKTFERLGQTAMPRSTLTGSRIRARRIDSGIKQAALARECGISSSYLNLIEHNRRRIGGALLNKIARVLNVEPATLSEGAESALTAALEAAAAEHGEIAVERDRGEEFAGRFPGWARLVERQSRDLERLRRAVDILNDRLTFDPHLAASMHDVLSTVTSIRSTSAILADGADIEREWQDRFHRNLYEDSQRLAQSAEGLVAYLDRSADADQSLSLPLEELEVWLEATDWRVSALEGGDVGRIDGLIKDIAPSTPGGADMARRFLERYAEDARAVPFEPLALAVRELGADPLRLADRFSADLPCILRRLSTLPDDAFDSGLRAGLVACDASGTLTFRKPVTGFDLPRYGAACPIWPMFQALQRPGAPITALVRKDGRDARPFRVTAIATQSFPAGYGGPPVTEALMLLIPHGPDAGRADFRVGTSCRVCSVTDCAARREPTILTLTDTG